MLESAEAGNGGGGLEGSLWKAPGGTAIWPEMG